MRKWSLWLCACTFDPCDRVFEHAQMILASLGHGQMIPLPLFLPKRGSWWMWPLQPCPFALVQRILVYLFTKFLPPIIIWYHFLSNGWVVRVPKLPIFCFLGSRSGSWLEMHRIQSLPISYFDLCKTFFFFGGGYCRIQAKCFKFLLIRIWIPPHFENESLIFSFVMFSTKWVAIASAGWSGPCV
jgi:hypothetical protein